MSKELFDAVQMLAQEKGIPEDYLYEKISAAIVVAAKHDYNGKDIVHCDIDPEKQRFKVYVTKNVVEEVEDPDTDLTLEEAQAIKKSAKVGKTIDIPLKTKEFGRIIAQTAKHVIRQGIREAERGKLMEEFQSKNQELISAKVLRVDPVTGNATLEIGKNEAVLPKAEQVPGEELVENSLIKIFVVDVKDGKMTGEVESVLFKGVHYEIMVETVPGTHVTVNMHVNKNYAITSEDGKEKISANDFYLDLEDMKDIDDKEIIARADAQAWNPETDEFISIHDIDTDLKQEVGEYTVTFSTNNKTSITRKIWVVDQRVVENKKANEAVSAFNFFKTVDEIKESMAIDTDLKTWANAQGWKLDDENETVDLDVDYDFDPETIEEGFYKVTFWTTGREFKIHTTDYVEEGKEVGLTFFAEDIHVMEKMGF